MQGSKKLKLSDKTRNMQMQTTSDAKHATLEQARREFWVMNSKSNYAHTFGETPK